MTAHGESIEPSYACVDGDKGGGACVSVAEVSALDEREKIVEIQEDDNILRRGEDDVVFRNGYLVDHGKSDVVVDAGVDGKVGKKNGRKGIKKSRGGCFTCKRQKIKCELEPFHLILPSFL